MSNQPWTEADNERRCELIDEDILGTITRDDWWELRTLTNQLHRHKAEVAPLPIKEVTATLKALKESAVEQEREAFEAWAETRFYRLRRKGNDYHDTQASIAWIAWLARAELDRGDLPKLMEVPEGETSCDT